MHIRDRIRELRRVPASELRPNPRNWRTHPPRQRDALQGLLAEVGYADALLARELPDGSLELIDGHLRAETTPHQLVPVLVLDVTETEAAKILATHDPLAALAEVDQQQLNQLLHDIETNSPALQEMLADLARQSDAMQAAAEIASDESGDLPERYQILVDCRDESEQSTLLARLTAEGRRCRALIA